MQDIRKARKYAGITQQELALAAGMSIKSLSLIESGKTQPTLVHWYTLQRLCRDGVGNAETCQYRFNGEALYTLRTNNGISQKMLEKELLLPATITSAWETGKKIPSVNAFGKLCVYFGVSPDYFFIRIDGCE